MWRMSFASVAFSTAMFRRSLDHLKTLSIICTPHRKNSVLRDVQKSGIVQSDLSATTSSQTSNPVSDFEFPLSRSKKIDTQTCWST
ncbi:hypothetical protein EVAR_10407_1 [Eumeta japonica]|uniref:Uncharacterized protein n=1 Tax=Eumeta variegata TaxID=151549 RepID=A0A4C1UDY0_EUMVA|nr:hypothetical protein EVAR_10407_1 [Eumeta japonica]